MSRNSIFFTLNGRYLGIAANNVEITKDLYPSVCLQSIKEEISVNFFRNPQETFSFDLDEFKNDLA